MDTPTEKPVTQAEINAYFEEYARNVAEKVIEFERTLWASVHAGQISANRAQHLRMLASTYRA